MTLQQVVYFLEIVRLAPNLLQLPDGEKIEYIPWDFKRCAKRRGSRILTEMSPCIKRSLQLTSLFVCAPTSLAAKAGESQGKMVDSLLHFTSLLICCL